MKKLLLFIILTSLFLGCSSDDEEDAKQTFFVNVYYQYDKGSEPKPVDKAFVYLFKDNGKEIDRTNSLSSVALDGEITFSDGSKDLYSFKPEGFGIATNIFSDIPNGSYILWVTYNSYSMFASSYKKIAVNYDYRTTTEKKTFIYDTEFEAGYNFRFQDWSKAW